MSWGGDTDVAPLTRPCAACGGAFQYLSPVRLCDACQADHDAAMEEVEARERADEDYTARRSFYNG